MAETAANESREMSRAEMALLAFRGAHQGLQYGHRLSRKKSPLEETDIKRIHWYCMKELLTGYAAGGYRSRDVGISRASVTPPHWRAVPELMKEFNKELNSRLQGCCQRAEDLPYLLETVAFALYVLLRIHPFEDGNGRTVRILCDSLLKRYGFRPILTWPSEKDHYVETLGAVDRSGNLAHLELFLAQNLVIGYQGGTTERDRLVGEQLENIITQKKEEIGKQRNAFDSTQIWSEFNRPCFT